MRATARSASESFEMCAACSQRFPATAWRATAPFFISSLVCYWPLAREKHEATSTKDGQ